MDTDTTDRREKLSWSQYGCIVDCVRFSFVGNCGAALTLLAYSLKKWQKVIEYVDIAAAFFSLAGYVLYWYLTSDYRRKISRRRRKLYLTDVCLYLSALLGIALSIAGLVMSVTDTTEVYRISYICIYSLDTFFMIPITIHWIIASRDACGEYNTLP